MKTNIVTKIIWFAVCATVLLSVESLVRADDPPPVVQKPRPNI